MKTISKISVALMLGLFLMMSASVYAQDPTKAAPNVYKKVLLDNDKVRIIQIEFAPGETAPWHHHPNHCVYALTSGKLEITDKGKSPNTVEIKEGTAMYMPAVTHMAKNVGGTTLKLIVTEMKSMDDKMDATAPAEK